MARVEEGDRFSVDWGWMYEFLGKGFANHQTGRWYWRHHYHSCHSSRHWKVMRMKIVKTNASSSLRNHHVRYCHYFYHYCCHHLYHPFLSVMAKILLPPVAPYVRDTRTRGSKNVVAAAASMAANGYYQTTGEQSLYLWPVFEYPSSENRRS